MAHTIVGKLNKAATQFQAGESVGFGVRIGVKYYDRETKQDAWTNYEAVIFAKAAAQIQFYQSALIEGSVIELSGDQLKIKTFDGQNGQSISIELLNAKLGYVHTAQSVQQGGYAPQHQQPGFQQQPPQQQAPQHGYQQQGGFVPQQGGFQQQAPQQQGGFNSQNGGYAPQR